MRHRKNTVKLGRTTAQRSALMASLVCNLILAKRIKTTLPKARAAKRLADKMVTLGKKGTLAARRQAIATLRLEKAVQELFSAVAPAMAERKGGYTRVIKLGKRMSDSSEVEIQAPASKLLCLLIQPRKSHGFCLSNPPEPLSGPAVGFVVLCCSASSAVCPFRCPQKTARIASPLANLVFKARKNA